MEKHENSNSKSSQKSGRFSGHVGQKLGQRFGQKVVKKFGKEIAHKTEALGQKFDAQFDDLAGRVSTVAQTATANAKTGLDQILLNLEHRGLSFKDKQDLINRVGQTVLERAEKIRSQISEHPSLSSYTPSWMKEPLVKTSEPKATADASNSITEATVSEPAQAMQTNTLQDEEAATTDDLDEVTEHEATVGSDTDSKTRKKSKATKTGAKRSSK